MRIDLNADSGEGFGAYAHGADDQLFDVVSSANIACGFHAGDPHTMRAAVDACVKRGVAIGAHPGLPDRLGFGRRAMEISPREAGDFVLYQVGALSGFARAAGGRLRHVKLHGAFYHMASGDERLAEEVALAVRSLDPELLLYGLPGSRLEAAAAAAGLRYVPEGFADRAYTPSGELASRLSPGAVLERTEDVVRQAAALASGGKFRTLCVHGDTPRAAEHARRIADHLRTRGIIIAAPRLQEEEGE